MTNKKLWAAALLLSGAASGTVAAETTIHAFAPLSEVAFTAPKDNVGRYVSQRPSPADRLFQSDIIEKKIAEIKALLKNPYLAWMFEQQRQAYFSIYLFPIQQSPSWKALHDTAPYQ